MSEVIYGFQLYLCVTMGIGALRDLAEIEEIDSDELQGETVSVDAHNYLYKYMMPTVQYTNAEDYTSADGTELPVILGLLRGLKRFYENDITPVFVFDGTAHDLKADEIARRKSQKQDAAEEYESHAEEGNVIEAARYEARSQRLTGAMIAATQRLLDVLDIPQIEAHGAGEAQAAHMAKESDVISSIVSDDYDSLLFGAPAVIRNFTSSEPHERIYLEQLLDSNELTLEQLVWFAVFCGTDYNDGAYGYGPKTAKDAVLENDAETCRELVLENDDELTEAQLDNILDLFLDPQLMDTYPEPTSLTPIPKDDIESVVYEEFGLETDPIVSAVDSLAETIPSNSSLDSWT